MKRTKKLMLLEDFETQASQKTTTKTEVPTSKKTGEVIRTEVIADVDAILTNLETLSAQITESTLITEAGELEAVFKSIKSTWAVAKATSMLKKLSELEKKNNSDLISLKASAIAAKAKAELEKAGEDQSAEGKARTAKLKAKMEVAMAKLESDQEVEKEKAKNELDAFNVELGDAESDIAKDSALGKVYQATKMKVQADVRELGKTELAKQKMKEGNEKAAKELAEEIKGIQKQSEDLAKRISDGNSEAGDDMEELAGIKAYVPEIDAIQKANQALATIRDEAEKARESVVAESNIFGFDLETILESTLTDLYSASKSRANVAGLTKAKELAAKFKQAGTAKIEAQRALADKIKGQEVTKTVIIIAGGDGDAAKEGENGYTLTTFIKSLGGGTDIIPTEEYSTVKDAIEVEGEVDDAIAKAEASGGTEGKEKKADLETAVEGFKTEIDNLPKNDAGEVNPKDKATIEVKKFTAEIELAKINGEDTADLEAKLEQATAVANLAPVPQAGGGEPPVEDSLEIPYVRPLVEASVSGLMASDEEGDGYKYLKQQAKKLGVKVSVDKDPWGDGYDELTFTGDKSAVMKLAAISGHDTDINDGAYELSESKTSKTIKLDEGMSISEKFAILMNK